MLSIHDIVAETGACKEVSCLRVYEELLSHYGDKPLALLELGVPCSNFRALYACSGPASRWSCASTCKVFQSSLTKHIDIWPDHSGRPPLLGARSDPPKHR